ncbi:MAG: cytochrome c oxidase subunit II, partial [Chthoniobacterales bacterium]
MSCSTVRVGMTRSAGKLYNDNSVSRFIAGYTLPLLRNRCIAILLFALLAAVSAKADDETTLRPIANIFDPLSTPAVQISHIAILVLAICAGIFLIVSGILVYTIIKFRIRPDDNGREPPQVYGGTQIELAWTVLPILITLVLIAVTARTIGDIQNAKMPETAVKVRIVGHQWWWEIHYPDMGVVTANELHVPVSTKDQRLRTQITLQSADVAHSFWVPQLAGKTDLIPNHDNHTWIEPFKPGIYLGNCAEYCGTQHAHMLL